MIKLSYFKDIHTCNEHDINYCSIMKDHKLDKNRYEKWTGGPYYYSNMSLNIFVNALIHLIFLSVIKVT